MVASGQICAIENGRVSSRLDTYVRLAGSLGVTLDDLLAGVRWTPGTVEFKYQAGYRVEFETTGDPDASAKSSR
jgi:hypothetical protein